MTWHFCEHVCVCFKQSWDSHGVLCSQPSKKIALHCLGRMIDYFYRVSNQQKQLQLQQSSSSWNRHSSQSVAYSGDSIMVLNSKKKPELNKNCVSSYCHRCWANSINNGLLGWFEQLPGTHSSLLWPTLQLLGRQCVVMGMQPMVQVSYITRYWSLRDLHTKGRRPEAV